MTMHIVLQAKGGAGKSLVASILIENFMREGFSSSPVAIDMDTEVGTLSEFGGFPEVAQVGIQKSSSPYADIDQLFSDIEEEDFRKNWVIDTPGTGTDTFVEYLTSSGVFEFLAAAGHKVVIHVPIVGGPGSLPSLTSLKNIISTFRSSAEVVMWSNDFFGKVVIPSEISGCSGEVNICVERNISIRSKLLKKYAAKQTLGEYRTSELKFVFSQMQGFYNGIFAQLDEINSCCEEDIIGLSGEESPE